MYICEGSGPFDGEMRHEPIVHERYDCPLCHMMEELNESDDSLHSANEKLMELDSIIESLQQRIKEFEEADNVNER
jgi:hypothetical protein